METCHICTAFLTVNNIFGNGFYPPDCNECYKMMCKKCGILTWCEEPDSGRCTKCIKQKEYKCIKCEKFGNIITHDKKGNPYCIECA